MASKDAISSVLSQDMYVEGEISFKGKVRIDCAVKGNIRGEYLVLSETATVDGDLELGTLICHGRVNGNIKAAQVTMHKTSALQGRLQADTLSVEPGALLEGEIRAASRQQEASPPPTDGRKKKEAKK